MEAAEADMDKLTSGKRSKKNDADASRKQQAISRHQWHVAKMEQMIRMMDNDGNEVDIDDVRCMGIGCCAEFPELMK